MFWKILIVAIVVLCMVIHKSGIIKKGFDTCPTWIAPIVGIPCVFLLILAIVVSTTEPKVSKSDIKHQRSMVHMIKNSNVKKNKEYYHRLVVEEKELRGMIEKRKNKIKSWNYWWTINW